jgi:HAD superfamily hydrolase (TIGR01459 family)
MTDGLHPPILTSARDLLQSYDVLFCDVWGVVHDGHCANPGAMRALTQFRKGGGTVILVSNAQVPTHRVAAMLDSREVPRDAWDDIVSSGAIALKHVAEQGYGGVYYIGPRDRDAAFFSSSSAKPVDLASAEAIVCTGLTDDIHETVATYEQVLQQGVDQGLTFVCANPDFVVDVGGTLYLCAGALADRYEHLGGAVFWAGKPHPSAYGTAHVRAQELRGERVPCSRILAIGDAVRTDLKAAQNAAIDALFIASGIHRHETMDGTIINRAKLSRVLSADAPGAIAVMAHFDW